MNWTVAPTFDFSQETAQFSFAGLQVQSVSALPVYSMQFQAMQLAGEILEFAEAGQTLSLPVPVPRLAGLDELQVEQVGFDLSSASYEDETTVSAQNVSADGLSVAYSAPANAPANLLRIEIQGLSIPASESATYVVKGGGTSGSDSHVVYRWDAEEEKTAAEVGGDIGDADYLHFLIRPAVNGNFGPPMAAVPYFAMPGKGGAMYGPALGGASLALYHDDSGVVRAVLRFPAPLASGSFKLLIGKASEGSKSEHGGLPNDVEGIAWSAENVIAYYDVRPAGVTVTANVIGGSSDEPVVARFDTDPGGTPVHVDFAPVARSLLKAAYPSSSGDDLGLQLNFVSDSPGKIRVDLADAAARYLRYPLGDTALSSSLKGAPEHVEIPVNENLKPSGFSFAIDGVFGPARLVAAADDAPQKARQGFRVAETIRIGRRMALDQGERNLPLARIAVFGRASEAGELLLTLHGGDPTRIGPPLAGPLSIPLQASPAPKWHRIEFPSPGLLPPHPEAVWIVAQASHGVFWWYADFEQPGPCQRSQDDGGSWSKIEAKPMSQLAVFEIDDQGNPSPVDAVSLAWTDGILNADIVGVGDQADNHPPEFRRFWVAQVPAHDAFLNRIPELGGILRLGFSCRRDVDLSLSQAVLVYNPWEAGGN